MKLTERVAQLENEFAQIRAQLNLITIHCPRCHATKIKKNGITYKGKQQYRCLNLSCSHHFSLTAC